MQQLIWERSLATLDKTDDDAEEPESRAEDLDDEQTDEGLWGLGIRERESGARNANTNPGNLRGDANRSLPTEEVGESDGQPSAEHGVSAEEAPDVRGGVGLPSLRGELHFTN